MKEESTHFIFNEQGVFISPDILPVFKFLMDIEKEIESFLGFNKKLNEIKESYVEMLNFVTFLNNKLREQNIDFNYTFKEHPEKFVEKLEFYIPLRSQFIVLFASIEVLFTLHNAYEFETAEEDKLRRSTMDTDNTKKFLNHYFLTDKNKFYKQNRKRLSKINSTGLRDLRNSLTHFFSIGHGGLSLSPEVLKERSNEFEKILKSQKKGHIIFLSEQDLYGLIKEANILRLKRWSKDFESNSEFFKRKFQFVIDLVNRAGAVTIHNKEVQI